MQGKKLDCTLITNPEDIFYLSRCSSGENPGALLIPGSAPPLLIVPEGEAGSLKENKDLPEIRTYLDYDINQKVDVPANLLSQIKEGLRELKTEKEKAGFLLGIEARTLPSLFSREIKREFGQVEFVDIGSLLIEMRVIKTPQEIALIKKAAIIAGLGQKTAQENLKEGIREIELYTRIKSAMEVAAGEPLLVKGDLISGPRTEQMGGNPTPRKIKEGDLVISDILPKVGGYWADTTRTFVLGNPSPKQKEIIRIVTEALEEGIKSVRPGIKASALDGVVRNFIEKAGYQECFPHHSGHGLGTEHFESPLIIPANDMELKEGMVFTLEPGIYIPGFGGVRVEEDVLVTAEGCEVLSRS